MAAPTDRNVPSLALRGSRGIWMVPLSSSDAESQTAHFPMSTSERCKVMTFSRDGNLFAYCDGVRVQVVNIRSNKELFAVPQPRTVFLYISPCNTILVTWEPYMVQGGNASPNLKLWDMRTGEFLQEFIQKKQVGWCPQWSIDENICARMANNEVHFFERNNFDEIKQRLHLQKVLDFSLPTCIQPYHVAAYVPGSKGQPSFVRVYKYPNFGGPAAAIANKSFYKADKVDLIWNNKGTSLLVLTVSDTSAESYYGEQGLHYVDVNGGSCLVPRAKNGPVYNVEWNPRSTDFCVVYGFMPAKATLYNLKCEVVFDFGTGPRNSVYYNPHGSMLCLAGFGNLRGNIEFWDLKNKRLISNPTATDSTNFQWCPDGVHVMTATTAPRLRVGNGYKIWHYSGNEICAVQIDDGELWEAQWQNAEEGVYPEPRLTGRPSEAAKSDGAGRYVPPAMRDRPGASTAKSLFHTEYEPPSNVKQEQQAEENMSKAARKNKKKREAKKAKEAETPHGASHEAAAAGETYVDSGPAASLLTTGDPEKDKKIRNLSKKLQQIEKLKAQQAEGKSLEKNQLEKLKSEATILQELTQLQIS